MKRPKIEPLCRLLSPILVTLAVLIAAPPADAAAVYRWTDAQGTVHFSDRPDDSPAAERIEVRPPPAAAVPPPRGGAPEDTASEAPLQPDATAQAEIREKNCTIARETLAHNEAIDRMYRLGPDGERIFLTDEERGARMQRSRDDVGKWCD